MRIKEKPTTSPVSRLSIVAMARCLTVGLLTTLLVAVTAKTLPNTCDSPIYCYGNLLHTIQMAKLYNDSKTFVDMKLKSDVNTTLENFDKFIVETNNNPTKGQLRDFVANNFEEGQELEAWNPPDYKPNPKFLDNIENLEIQQFAKNIISIWPVLGRKVRSEVQTKPEQYSLVYVDNGLIIPGGRFREFYYWDSYWIIKGLIISEMCNTAQGMIENFMSMVDRFGFVPNGGRVYYLQRSQPPLLTPMTRQYFDKCTSQKDWLATHVDTLAQELKYWLNKTVDVQKNGIKYTLAHYNSESVGPRPESYREDFNTASMLPENEKQNLYNELKSAAESGWDFTTRWFFDSNGGTAANLTGLKTRRVLPVDLNAYLCGAFNDISYLYSQLNKTAESAYWLSHAQNLQNAIKNILWNDEDGIWYDYDSKLNQQRKYFAASNLAPLWSKCINSAEMDKYGQKVYEYLSSPKIDILQYIGGTPATLDASGEQWDYPNCWPPLQALVVQGLDNSGNSNAISLAKTLANRWVYANLAGYLDTNEMFEKYDANTPGGYGGGGEYVVQSGFGWTNGVVLEFINKYFTQNC